MHCVIVCSINLCKVKTERTLENNEWWGANSSRETHLFAWSIADAFSIKEMLKAPGWMSLLPCMRLRVTLRLVQLSTSIVLITVVFWQYPRFWTCAGRPGFHCVTCITHAMFWVTLSDVPLERRPTNNLNRVSLTICWPFLTRSPSLVGLVGYRNLWLSHPSGFQRLDDRNQYNLAYFSVSFKQQS